MKYRVLIRDVKEATSRVLNVPPSVFARTDERFPLPKHQEARRTAMVISWHLTGRSMHFVADAFGRDRKVLRRALGEYGRKRSPAYVPHFAEISKEAAQVAAERLALWQSPASHVQQEGKSND